jgi:hypothetical protein
LLFEPFGLVRRQIGMLPHSRCPVAPIAIKGTSLSRYFDMVYLMEV